MLPLAPRNCPSQTPRSRCSYLVGTCPHDLFTNTKQDLGPCPKVHSEPLKAELEALPEQERKKYGFDYDYMRDLQKYIDECNRRIDAAQRRLEKTPDEIRQTNVLLKSISDHNGSIGAGLVEVEILGELGEVSRAYDEYLKVRMAQAAKGRAREGAQGAERHERTLGAPEAAGVRRLRGVSESPGQ